VFTLSAPDLSLPANASEQYVDPVVLSWAAPTIPDGYNLTYYVYGDNVDGSTYLGSVTVGQYFWWGLATGSTYYWKVKAGIEGQNSSFSEIWQFDLDLCTADADYDYALDYPMSYNNVTDTITVWGSNGTNNYTAMGSNSTSAITFAQIYAFGRAKRGVCAVTNPGGGSTYIVLSNLEIGNTSSLLNTTFVKTTGEAISFSKQVKLNFNATLIAGQLSNGSNPYAGSTLSFSGTGANGTYPGELHLKSGSNIELYDSLIIHGATRQYNYPWLLIWYGDTIVKRSSFENWAGLSLRSPNNTWDDVVLTDVVHGLHPDVAQVGILENIKSRFADQFAFHLRSIYAQSNNVTITGLEIAESSWADMKIQNYTGVANLINPSLNWSSINWSTGSFSGEVNRKYTYDLTTEDSTGVAIENASIKMVDVKGDTLFDLSSESDGTIGQQTITRGIYDYSYKTGNEQGPHRLYLKKYGKTFIQIVKAFSAATVETTQLSDNPFVTSGAVGKYSYYSIRIFCSFWQ
jgi:hypothetical protein